MNQSVAFIGLGVMGSPMAGHLASAGCRVKVYNRTPGRAVSWTERHGGEAVTSIAEAAKDVDVVLTCVGADPDLREIYQGPEGILANARDGAILVDHTTASASVAEELAEGARELGLAFIDAPVSGGQQGAENGKLTIMCGGDQSAFDAVKPLMDHYARAVSLMGPSGAGQRTKMANQIAIAGLLQGLSEAVHFAEKSGLDVTAVLDVISKGAAQSWQMENRGTTMLAGEYNHGFAVNWMRKDLDICLNEARRSGARLPVTALVDQFYGDVQAMGGGRWDTSSLLERLRQKPGRG
ncbi:NAD(P)-dependent oxidoreductase [Marinobacter sp.]|uniref:NAD(P)-dependent oxidoreductase n=1 Tax=Marinobacter sp. TaxID=50741 RepID=UPI0038509533